jgi:hypothetical protein
MSGLNLLIHSDVKNIIKLQPSRQYGWEGGKSVFLLNMPSFHRFRAENVL